MVKKIVALFLILILISPLTACAPATISNPISISPPISNAQYSVQIEPKYEQIAVGWGINSLAY